MGKPKRWSLSSTLPARIAPARSSASRKWRFLRRVPRVLPAVSKAEQDVQDNGGLVGLRNLGNTCFANACLQSMLSIPDLPKRMRSAVEASAVASAGSSDASARARGQRLKSKLEGAGVRRKLRWPISIGAAPAATAVCGDGGADGDGGDVALRFLALAERRRRAPAYGMVTPAPLLQAVLARAPDFVPGLEHDSHEFLRAMISQLDDDFELCFRAALRADCASKRKDGGQSGCDGDNERSHHVAEQAPAPPSRVEPRVEAYDSNQEQERVDSGRDKDESRSDAAATSSRDPVPNVIQDMFRGQLQNVVQCRSCGYRSTCTEPFMDLSLSIRPRLAPASALKERLPHSSTRPRPRPKLSLSPPLSRTMGMPRLPPPISPAASPSSASPSSPSSASPSPSPSPQPSPGALKLEQCLGTFTGEEVLNGDNMWHCPHCSALRAATKSVAITHCPEILVIHLKRFHYSSLVQGKLTTEVQFPARGLDMAPFMHAGSGSDGEKNTDATHASARNAGAAQGGEDASVLYDLVSTVNHIGTADSGHYTADALSARDGQWYSYDDSSVWHRKRAIGHSRRDQRSAYVLLYKRRRSNDLNHNAAPQCEDNAQVQPSVQAPQSPP